MMVTDDNGGILMAEYPCVAASCADCHVAPEVPQLAAVPLMKGDVP